MNPCITGIGLALPQHSIAQSEAARFAAEFSAPNDHGATRAFERLYAKSGILQRSSVLLTGDQTTQSFFQPGGEGVATSQRMKRYAVEAPPLACLAAERALLAAALDSSQIDQLITVTCTGFFAPGLDFHLVEKLNLRRDIARLQVGFMGCHGVFNALQAAKNSVQAASRNVLVVAVELCSLHFADQLSPPDELHVSNAIFADGSCALVLTPRGVSTPRDVSWELEDFSSILLPDSSEMMGWNIGDTGFAMSLSPQLPALIERSLALHLERWLGDQRALIKHWAIHPGGIRILQAVQRALVLEDVDLEPSREVLRQHGNMSSPTVAFILEKIANSPRLRSGELCGAIGFGPGLVCETMLLRAV